MSLTTPPKPLNNAQIGGFFIVMKYNKLSKSFEEQLSILKARGLVVNNEKLAIHYLKNVGYFRLSGYSLPFQVNFNEGGNHIFLDDARFEDVVSLYQFDRNLRLITIDALEKIEVGLKATLNQVMCELGGVHWYMDKNYFHKKFNYESFLKILRKEIGCNDAIKHAFIQHYLKKYTEPELPPSWMIFEVMSLGRVSIIFKNIKFDFQKVMAKEYGLRVEILVSWLHSLSYLRNLAAHHQRLWNRSYTIKPIIFRKMLGVNEPFSQDRFYAQALVIQILLREISPHHAWKESLKNLFEQSLFIDIKKLGFVKDWFKYQSWK